MAVSPRPPCHAIARRPCLSDPDGISSLLATSLLRADIRAAASAVDAAQTCLCRRKTDRVTLALTDMPVYTGGMKIVKVRRVGNSNVVSLPRELEASGYVPGTSVLVEELADGELRILPTEMVRTRVRQIAGRTVSDRAEALEILAKHDADLDPSK